MPRDRASFGISCRSASLTPPSAQAIWTSGTNGKNRDAVDSESEGLELLNHLRIIETCRCAQVALPLSSCRATSFLDEFLFLRRDEWLSWKWEAVVFAASAAFGYCNPTLRRAEA